ncbi:zinc finger protein 41-like [Cylas formicarius]|uniref:zinc finger protein 41-like n=1 Tax=Cylas formicarius TaxID=197179 RepID=UPI0029587DF9|nr:zinc finger protein 41-like [Cylas formicarius]
MTVPDLFRSFRTMYDARRRREPKSTVLVLCFLEDYHADKVVLPVTTTTKSERPETSEMGDENPYDHGYGCQCAECLNKYGLQLLLRGIEEHTKTTSGARPSTSSFYDDASFLHPSTSSGYMQSTSPWSSRTYEEHLPKSLDEIGQPQASTSTGYRGSFHDDTQSKKIKRCAHCDKEFTHKGDYNKHQRVHTNERPYPCGVCGKTFTHSSNLHRHERTTHSVDRPFTCVDCNKSFNRKDKLEAHRKSKTCNSKRGWK